ncbi:hypothetical protein SAMN04488056_11810 [Cohaesibacter marisflavi]|uniref:Uncharacterized protein n=1 Tax=Cohaesibacter marisflavi TaxID=655353 RepID=A0A1I5LTG2_9HYPH|nr:hypothetical protein SAMN04488056_11810 [Cohaesibacter marisflavi]
MLFLQEITNGLNAQQYPKLGPTNTIENWKAFAIVKSANSILRNHKKSLSYKLYSFLRAVGAIAISLRNPILK